MNFTNATGSFAQTPIPTGDFSRSIFSNWLSARAGRSVLRACDSKANFISAARIDNLV
jgi:hypothetical protein